METTLIDALNTLSTTGAWTLIIYKLIDWAELISALLIIGWGISKIWPVIKKALED